MATKKSKKSSNKTLIIASSIIGVLILIFLIIIFTGKTGSFEPSKILQTCKDVSVPYDTQEPYQATEEYQVDMKYEVVTGSKSTFNKGFDVWARGDVTIRNVDTETGMFTVSQTFKTLSDPAQTFTSNQYIMSGESKAFTEQYDVDLSEDFNVNYVVTPAKKTLTRTVTKYRTVTSYRTERQCN